MRICNHWILSLLFLIFLFYFKIQQDLFSEKKSSTTSSSSENQSQQQMQSTTPPVVINAKTIISITNESNQEIVASKYNLEVAEYAFKHFKRELSSFTPFLLDSDIERDWRRNRYAENDKTHSQQNYGVRVGMEKEFFNGSSIFLGMGHRGGFNETESANQYVEANAKFPLFGSYTTLSRVTSRAYEENEMYNARLDYIDTVRNSIQGAQENYFWLLNMLECVSLVQKCVEDYTHILELPRIKSQSNDFRQIQDEIKSTQSDILKYQGSVESYCISLKSSIGLTNLSLNQVERMNLYEKEYYGKSYMNRQREELLKEAEDKDIEIRVLENARKNSFEKKRLAEKGKWDIFFRVFGEYDFEGEGNSEGQDGYNVGVGISVKKIDSSLLRLSFKKAEAEIKKYDAKILNRQNEIKNEIDSDWTSAKNKRSQSDELIVSVDSRKLIFQQKLKDYADGKETIDNLIQARKNQLETEITLVDSLGYFYENITDLDCSCGVYFSELGISIDQSY